MRNIRKIAIVVLAAFVLLAVYLLVRPSKEEPEQIEISHNVVLQQVEALGRLEVVKYNISDVIEYKKIRQWLPNSRTAVIVVGEVIACVDLTQIGDEDINVAGDSVSILLPVPEICSFKIDHSRSRVYDVQYGLWDTSELVDEAYREAEKQLYHQALSMGITADSRKNTIKVLTPLLHALGFTKVSLEFKDSAAGKQTELKMPSRR